MSIRKTYQSLGAIPLSVTILIGEASVSVDFTGGYKHPIVRMPLYATSDPEIHKQLENYPGYKKSYILVLVEEISEDGEVLSANDPTLDPSMYEDPKGEIVMKTLAEAKSYLKKKFNIIAETKSKREDVNELFAQQGIKLILTTDKKS